MATQQVMRDFESWQQSLKNFEWLTGAVPGAMDIDVFVERRGNFLVLETKPMQGNGVHVGFGQHLALDALSRVPRFTVYLVGESEGGNSLHILNYAQVEPQRFRTSPVLFRKNKFIRTTKEGLNLMVGEWYQDASASR